MAPSTRSAAKAEVAVPSTAAPVARPMTAHSIAMHMALVGVTLAPAVLDMTGQAVNITIVSTASLAVYVGCHRSCKIMPPAEDGEGEESGGLDLSEMQPMEKGDAMRFPLVGSCVLFSLFMAFKILPKHIVNNILTLYFLVLGILALAGTLTPLVTPYIPEGLRTKTIGYHHKVKVPLLMDEAEELTCELPFAVAGCLAIPVVAWYVMSKHWLANNILGLAFSVQGLEMMSCGSYKIAAILLGGLFFYDIFWVFGTPVMVNVARNVDAPIKLLFPRNVEAGSGLAPFSMLGLGDIVIPGIVVALLLRFDAQRGLHSLAKQTTFLAGFAGYVFGLGATIVVMNVFEAAQPALLYIVPAVLGFSSINALCRGEFKELLDYDESAEEEEEGEENGSAVEAKKDQ